MTQSTPILHMVDLCALVPAGCRLLAHVDAIYARRLQGGDRLGAMGRYPRLLRWRLECLPLSAALRLAAASRFCATLLCPCLVSSRCLSCGVRYFAPSLMCSGLFMVPCRILYHSRILIWRLYTPISKQHGVAFG